MKLMQAHLLEFIQLMTNRVILSIKEFLHTSIIIHKVTPKILFMLYLHTFIIIPARYNIIKFMGTIMRHILTFITFLKCQIEVLFNITSSTQGTSL
jgi:hypothetical protein